MKRYKLLTINFASAILMINLIPDIIYYKGKPDHDYSWSITGIWFGVGLALYKIKKK